MSSVEIVKKSWSIEKFWRWNTFVFGGCFISGRSSQFRIYLGFLEIRVWRVRWERWQVDPDYSENIDDIIDDLYDYKPVKYNKKSDTT